MADRTSSGTGAAFQRVGVVLGVGALLAVVVGVAVGLATGDVAGGLATWGSPVFFVAVAYAVFAAFRTGQRRG